MDHQHPSGMVQAPAVITWFKVYCALMALLYLLVMAAGVGLIFFADEIAADDPQTETVEMLIVGGVMAAMGAILTLPFAAGPFLPRQPWVWIFHLVLICLGLTSACCMPVTIPLLIFWIKPEAKVWFGRNP